MFLKRCDPSGVKHFHYIYAHANGDCLGFATTIVAHIPAHLRNHVDEWLFDKFLPRAAGGVLPKGAVRLSITDDRCTGRARRHAHLLRSSAVARTPASTSV